MRKKLIIALSLLCITGSIASAETSLQELPMYGGVPETEQQKETDRKFIDQATALVGSRELASEQALRKGWQLYHSGDQKTAIKRFNQAWLFTPNNPEVFHAFGVYLASQGEGEQAIVMYQKALELNPKHAMAMCNLARSYKDRALKAAATEAPNKQQQMQADLNRALKLCEEASHLTDNPYNLGYIYYQWAVFLAMTGNFAGVWENIHLSQQHDGQFIQKDFIEQLSRDMPEPKN